MSGGCQGSIHWLDILADRVEEFLRNRNKDAYIFNGGLSVSGLQHIGRLRGEVLIPEVLRRILEKRGYRIKQMLTIYTQDPWKGKASQRREFDDPEAARRYTGWPLIKVPDPKGCHENWVEHYWSDFGPYLSEFTDGKIEIVTTTELYRGPLKEFILREVLPLKDKIRGVINKYRGRKPYPEGWIPLEPVCERCGRIDKTVALQVEGERVRYRCKNCGYEGWAPIWNGKLNWRLEWAGIWKVLSVDFEPYGKDHATPGGSRDSCVDLAQNVFKFEPPLGEWYEWVSLRVNRKESDMSSSGFVGITPREWLEIAHPQILRFLYFYTHPHKKVVIDLSRIPQYYDQYYRAERVYFGLESIDDCEELEYLRRTYELSHPREPPKEMPVQVPYMHAAILAQIVGPDNIEGAVARLRKTGHISESLDEYSRRWIEGLLRKSYMWVQKYGPESARFTILREPPADLELDYSEYLCKMADELESVSAWTEDEIKDALIRATENMTAQERKRLYREFYMLFTGKPFGPRAAPLLSLLDKSFVIGRLRVACGRLR